MNVFGTSDSKHYVQQSLWDEWRDVSHCATNRWTFLFIYSANKAIFQPECENGEARRFQLPRRNEAPGGSWVGAQVFAVPVKVPWKRWQVFTLVTAVLYLLSITVLPSQSPKDWGRNYGLVWRLQALIWFKPRSQNHEWLETSAHRIWQRKTSLSKLHQFH